VYKIIIGSSRVEKEINNLSDTDFANVDNAIRTLKDNPRPHGCEKLTGNIYRIRVGAYRVIYQINDKKRTVEIGKVDRRQKRTYKDVEALFRS